MSETSAIDRLRRASRELHHTYGVNWTTALLTLGLALFIQAFGIAAKYEHSQGGFSASTLESLLSMLVIAQAVLVVFWLLMCLHAYLGPEEADSR